MWVASTADRIESRCSAEKRCPGSAPDADPRTNLSAPTRKVWPKLFAGGTLETDVHWRAFPRKVPGGAVRMSEHSEIEWTDATWNPVRGCTKITPGCDHCYAETFAERFRGVPGHPYEQGFDLRLVPEKLAEPLRWKTPKTIFVNSMSDLFHKEVPEDYVEAVGRVMARANWHTYQVLTKRSSLLRNMLQTRLHFAAGLPNIWWGVSVEDRAHGLVRIKHLQQAPAAVRFLSIEPLLEDLGDVNLEGIHWVIVGAEALSGTVRTLFPLPARTRSRPWRSPKVMSPKVRLLHSLRRMPVCNKTCTMA